MHRAIMYILVCWANLNYLLEIAEESSRLSTCTSAVIHACRAQFSLASLVSHYSLPVPNCLSRFQLAGMRFGYLTVAYMIVVTLTSQVFFWKATTFTGARKYITKIAQIFLVSLPSFPQGAGGFHTRRTPWQSP